MNFWYIILAVAVLLPVPMVIQNNRVPRDLGVTDGRLREVPASPNAVSSQTADESKLVEPLPFLGDLEESRQRIISAAKEYGGVRIIIDEGVYLHMVFTTPGFRFKDDVEFYFADGDKVIHYRSASRVGYGDLGLNRARYDEIRRVYLGDGD